MSKKAPPAFQFYARDYYMDVAGATLSAAGAHAKLKAWSWMNGPVPKDATARARALGVERKVADGAWLEIQHLWTETDAGFVEDAIEAQRGPRQQLHDQASVNGKKGAAKRWLGHELKHGLGHSPGHGSSHSHGHRRSHGNSHSPGHSDSYSPGDSSAIFDLQDQDQIQERSALSRSVQAVEKPPMPLAEQELHEPTPQVLERIAHSVLDDVQAGSLDPQDAKEEAKRRIAKARLTYHAGLVNRAFDAAETRRQKVAAR